MNTAETTLPPRHSKYKLLLGLAATVVFAFALCAIAFFTWRHMTQQAGQEQSKQNLARLCTALSSHQDKLNYLPSQAILHPDTGERMLSWRVALLPFLGIEEKALYDQIRLDEPWDSDHNRQFWDKMPDVYRLPGKPNDGTTHYQVFHGNEALFVNPKHKVGQGFQSRLKYKLNTIPDGSSNTLFAVEAAEPVNWMKPEDIPFEKREEGTPLHLLGNHWGGSHVPAFRSVWGERKANVVMCDGAVRGVNLDNVQPGTLQWAIMPYKTLPEREWN